MKIFIVLLLTLFVVNTNSYAQNLTIILLRHGEKDVSLMANKDDPDLTEAGLKRAERLYDVLKKYKPEIVYSTVYKRAKFTAFPLAGKINPLYRVQIEVYNPDYIDDFAETLLKSRAKCIVVIGHNTTTPMLANALIKQDKYRFMEDDEFNRIWIIKIRGKKITDQVIEY